MPDVVCYVCVVVLSCCLIGRFVCMLYVVCSFLRLCFPRAVQLFVVCLCLCFVFFVTFALLCSPCCSIVRFVDLFVIVFFLLICIVVSCLLFKCLYCLYVCFCLLRLRCCFLFAVQLFCVVDLFAFVCYFSALLFSSGCSIVCVVCIFVLFVTFSFLGCSFDRVVCMFACVCYW